MSAQGITMPFPVRLRDPLKMDPMLLGITITLILGGLVVLASASTAISERESADALFYVKRQLVAIFAGGLAGGICLLIPMAFWRQMGPVLLLAGLALLLVVLIPGVGKTVNGATRWIDIGFMNVQVSEPARLCFILYLAGYLVRRSREVQTTFVGFLKPMLVISIAAAALLAEPDFGAAMVLMVTVMTMLFIAGARIRDFLMFFLVSLIAFVALALTSEYRVRRLTGFLDPWKDEFNSGYQLVHSLIAIGRGEWFGVGLGDSVQKLFYLPEAHTDFVFAVYAEEFGLVGSVFAIGLFFALIWRVFGIAREAAEKERHYESYVAIGLGTWLGIQAFINLGVNMGVLPTKGLTLPLVSYGRSSMIMVMVAIAILLRIHHEVQTEARTPNRRRRRKKA